MENFELSISNWIQTFLSTPSKTLNNLPPCPFAKKALMSNKVIIHQLNLVSNISMKDYFKTEIKNYVYDWPDEKEVIVLGCEPDLISVEDLEACVDETTEDFLEQYGYVALEDHPNKEERVKDLVFNQGEYALILIQESKKLKNARQILDKQNYYINWDKDYYNDVVDR